MPRGKKTPEDLLLMDECLEAVQNGQMDLSYFLAMAGRCARVCEAFTVWESAEKRLFLRLGDGEEAFGISPRVHVRLVGKQIWADTFGMAIAGEGVIHSQRIDNPVTLVNAIKRNNKLGFDNTLNHSPVERKTPVLYFDSVVEHVRQKLKQ